jgi:hypothetical protein
MADKTEGAASQASTPEGAAPAPRLRDALEIEIITLKAQVDSLK